MMEEQKPIFDKQYCDDNNIRCKWFPLDEHLQTLFELLLDESVVPDGPHKGDWCLDGGYRLGIVLYAIMQYKECGYIKTADIEELFQQKSWKTERKAFEYAVELIEKARIEYAKKIWNGKHAHDK